MKKIARTLDLNALVEKKSHFLFGPRGVGKSFLIRETLQDQATLINLLRPEMYLRLSAHPEQLEEIILAEPKNKRKLIVIDEIQKIPLLLDEVHRLIEEQRFTFLLTGSSARKLRHGGVNLLGGRAWLAGLFPLTAWELGDDFDLQKYLQFGGLPAVYFSDYPREELQAYVATYIQEEIKAEGLVRRLPVFSAFLQAAALTSGTVLNYAKFASDLEVSAPTIREYFAILEDTLVGQLLQPWRSSRKRKASASAKFYFFDTGVAHTLAQIQSLDPHSDLFGRAFELWVFMELRAWLSYHSSREALSFWRIDTHCEVDFLIGKRVALEVKATSRLRDEDFKGLKALREEGVFKEFVVVSQDPIKRLVDGILCLPWNEFIPWLWKPSR